MTKRIARLVLFIACAAGAFWLWHARLERAAAPRRYVPVDRRPRIRPDYVDTVIPPNIAPLNFRVDEPGARYHVEIRSDLGEPITVTTTSPLVTIPRKPWRELLAANRGRRLYFNVRVEGPDGSLRLFDALPNTIAPEDIDGYLVYRLIDMAHNTWGEMGLYERDLEGYHESVVLHNDSFDGGCANCHTFLSNDTRSFILHFRTGGYGSAMLLVRDGVAAKVDTRTGPRSRPGAYASWHPDGRVLAFSLNKVRQFFHSAGRQTMDVMDLESDVALYLLDSNAVISTAALSDPDRMETYPAWSADGKYLYFCSAPILWTDRETVPPARFGEVRYDLMRIAYDAETGRGGTSETVLSAKETGLSITQPRASPDGRFLLFCMSGYGTFPVVMEDADLYLMDLATGKYGRLECNSDRCEAWHCWSSNSRWIAFASKRDNDLLARPYFSYVDEEGRAHKPFLLPQKDPAFYDSLLLTYNLPELVRRPVPVRGEQVARAIRSTQWLRGAPTATEATPRAGAPEDR